MSFFRDFTCVIIVKTAVCVVANFTYLTATLNDAGYAVGNSYPATVRSVAIRQSPLKKN